MVNGRNSFAWHAVSLSLARQALHGGAAFLIVQLAGFELTVASHRFLSLLPEAQPCNQMYNSIDINLHPTRAVAVVRPGCCMHRAEPGKLKDQACQQLQRVDADKAAHPATHLLRISDRTIITCRIVCR